MRRFMTKKAAAIGVAASLAVGGGVAFAIVSGIGSGTGSGGTTAGGAPTYPVTLSVQIMDTPPSGVPLSPGGPGDPVIFDATNLNPGPVKITTISLDTSSAMYPDGVSSTDSGCEAFLQAYNRNTPGPVGPANQFTMPTVNVNKTVPAGAVHYGLNPPTGLLTWLSLPNVDQGPCVGENLTLHVKTP
jgi:hypothetical protein